MPISNDDYLILKGTSLVLSIFAKKSVACAQVMETGSVQNRAAAPAMFFIGGLAGALANTMMAPEVVDFVETENAGRSQGEGGGAG